MRILWVSNYMGQFTGYGTICRNLLPKLQENTDHEFVHYAVSGLQNVPPFENMGVKVYGQTNQGGNLGVFDVPLVRQLENIDLVHVNFDCWAVSSQIQQAWDFPFSLYPPVDHDPLPKDWSDVMEKATEIAPYCKFGKRVIQEAEVDEDKIYKKPIYHAVNPEVYKPKDVDKEDVLNVDEDFFVPFINKNNQGRRAALERLLRSFKMFLEEDDVDEDKCVLFMNSNIQGKNSPNLAYLIQRLGLGDHVKMVNQQQRRYGLPEETLANFYNASDILLNANRGEGFGLPILESFACGKPAIATAFSSMPEILSGEEGEIKRDETDEDIILTDRGILVPTSDVFMSLGKHSWKREVYADNIVAALKYAYHNRNEMEKKGKNARKWVLKNDLDWDSIAKEWEEFFDTYENEHFEEDEMGIE